MNVSSSTTAQMIQSSSSTSNRGSSLSLEQQTIIEETLANYDSDSLSQSDAKEIVDIFKDAGIEPSNNFASALASVGFDAKEIGDLAGVSKTATAEASGPAGGRPAGGPPPGPPPSSSEDEEEIESIYDLLEALLSTDDEDEDTSISSSSSTNSILSGTGYDDESSSFETVLDFTSKIVRLKDDAKTDVMEMINEFTSDETNLEDAQTQKNLLTSLSTVLNKTDNYNTISFYA